MRNIRERPKLRLHIFSEQVDKSAEVAHLVAIIRRAEYGDALASVRNLGNFISCTSNRFSTLLPLVRNILLFDSDG